MVVLFTVFAMGGTTVPVLRKLGIRTGVRADGSDTPAGGDSTLDENEVRAKKTQLVQRAANKNLMLHTMKRIDRILTPIVQKQGSYDASDLADEATGTIREMELNPAAEAKVV